MNPTILNKLQFGFEIEGFFAEGMNERLNFRGNFVHDGSVRDVGHDFDRLQTIPQVTPRSCDLCLFSSNGELQEYCSRHDASYHHEGHPSTEYTSIVFDELDACLHDLRLFNKKSHAFNATCGLHFHVGMKNEKWRQLFNAASNYKYIEQLIGEAESYCDCQAGRLRSGWASQYFGHYRGRQELANATRIDTDAGYNVKYRCVRFHPEHQTLEFRFLSPCEHKVTNVRKLIASLVAYLGRNETQKAYAITETGKKDDRDIQVELELTKKKEAIDLVKVLGSPDMVVSRLRDSGYADMRSGLPSPGVYRDMHGNLYQADNDSIYVRRSNGEISLVGDNGSLNVGPIQQVPLAPFMGEGNDFTLTPDGLAYHPIHNGVAAERLNARQQQDNIEQQERMRSILDTLRERSFIHQDWNVTIQDEGEDE